ncbi:MAG: hypothetical protein QG670_1810 [Thermoproteota archaeon]|nr:hypothetical protein [Thermoproteota archaeon]
MIKNWKKCSDPEHSRIHPKWFNLDYYLSEYGVCCFCDNDGYNCESCSIGESENSIAQYSKDTKVYFSADNGRTKQLLDINEIPSRIEFMTLLIQEKIRLLGKKQLE